MAPRRRPIAELVAGDELPRVLDLLEFVTSEADRDDVLNAIVDAACALTGAAFGVLTVLDDEGRIRDFHIQGLDDAAVDAMGELPVGRGVLGRLMASSRPLRLQHVGSRPDAENLPPGHPDIDRFLGVPIRHAGRGLGMLYLGDRPDVAPFTRTDEHVLQWLADRAAQVLALEEARARAERREEWLRVFQRSVELLEPPIDRGVALTHVAELVGWMFQARAVVLARLVGDRIELVAEDPSTEALAGLGELASLDEQLAPGTPVHTAVVAAFADQRARVSEVGRSTVVIVPFPLQLTEQLVIGVVLRRDAHPPDQAELDLLTSFANQAVTSIDRLEGLAERQELMVLADRERIARDLHDVVIQRLFATGLQMQGLRHHLPVPERTRFDVVVRDLDQTIRDIRTTIFELSRLRGRSLRAEVRELVAEYAEPLGFRPTVDLEGPLDSTVPDRISDYLLATLREALSNVVRHAAARSVDVRLEVGAEGVVLRVADDGRGFERSAAESGLVNVRRRAQDLGGDVRVTSAPGSGTLLEWAVPLSD
ncbi:MAG TPA: GAF domain-containing sensor histidine kinase [Nocardioides sp.]